MSDLRLDGCRNDTLLGYLKALGVLRLVAAQTDSEARASWDGATFVLHTRLSREDLLKFFIESYGPTPIANPWNSSAGFDGKADRAFIAIARIRATKSARWSAYRRLLDFIFEKYIETGVRAQLLAAGQKEEFIRTLRARVPEEGLPWIDAAAGVTPRDVVYPYLLGSGGNDGRLDFSVNFMQRASDVVGDEPVHRSAALLADSLEDSTSAPLTPDAAIGQFSARHAGGVNSSSGFSADSLVNPWDYVLMMEGSLCFRTAVVRRLEYRGQNGPRAQSGSPFALRSVAGGYGTASVFETSRGELWLPEWDGKISYAGLTDLFRRGRVDLPSDGSVPLVRSAAIASEAAVAAVTMGAALGLREFKRIAFLQRNGLAFTATPSGVVHVTMRSRPFVAHMSSGVADWVERVRGTNIAEVGEVAERLRAFYESLFAIASDHKNGERRYWDLLSALARLEFAVARKCPEYPSPLPYLDSRLIDEAGTNDAARRLAATLSSLGCGDPSMRMRLHLEHVAFDGAKRRLTYDRSREPMLSRHPENTLSDVCHLRMRLASELGDDRWLAGTRYAQLSDIATMLEPESGSAFRERVISSLVAYSIIEPLRIAKTMRSEPSAAQLPAAYAVMKVVVDHPRARDPRIVAYLRARDPKRAIQLTAQRALLIDELPARMRTISGASIGDPRWFASALLIPIERVKESYRPLLAAALAVESNRLGDAVERYLQSVLTNSMDRTRST